jgi:hypothetical protein
MFFWAVVSDEIEQVIEFFPTRREAERMVADALQDEPDWRNILRVEKLELKTSSSATSRTGRSTTRSAATGS